VAPVIQLYRLVWRMVGEEEETTVMGTMTEDEALALVAIVEKSTTLESFMFVGLGPTKTFFERIRDLIEENPDPTKNVPFDLLDTTHDQRLN
jgi:hypothetical protein